MTDLEPAEHWLLSRVDAPATRVANMLIERYGLSVPVNIDELILRFADVQEISWTFSCDALVHNLASGRPTVFLRQLPSTYRRRRRFTLAHEAGHVCLGWHVGVPACKDVQNEGGPSGGPVADSGSTLVRSQEEEATQFAEALLFPDAYIAATAYRELPQFFAGLNELDISASATLMSMRKILLPGFVLAYPEGTKGEVFEVMSVGTEVPMLSRDWFERRQILSDLSYRTGVVTIGGRDVHWFQLVQPLAFDVEPDGRGTSQLLSDAIRRSGAKDPASMFQHANGVVSGLLGKPRTLGASQNLSILIHRCNMHPGMPSALIEDRDFILYLKRKVNERLRKLSL